MKQVKDYIFLDITSISEKSTLQRAIKTMHLHRISAIPVLNSMGHYIGCITEQNILEAAIPDYMKSIYNTSFMADLDQITNHLHSVLNEKITNFIDRNYPWVGPRDSMSYAADLLYRAKGTIIPVLENMMLIGLISTIDILSVALDEE